MKHALDGWGIWIVAAVAVCCNAVAQLLMKRAGVHDPLDWGQWFTATLASAVVLYGVSFALTALVFARLPLSVISPLMAGAVFALIYLLSVVFLNESIDATRIVGIALVLAGIGLLSRGA